MFRHGDEKAQDAAVTRHVIEMKGLIEKIREALARIDDASFGVCERCGERMVTEPVAKEILDKAKIDWKEFREWARLCPRCRRKKAAAALGLAPEKRG
jgi:DNA replicative helicase MCM subunit Mcm2 (Cdc46/Mcm family)